MRNIHKHEGQSVRMSRNSSIKRNNNKLLLLLAEPEATALKDSKILNA